MAFPISGDVSELAEGARLEIVCTCKTRTLGSNPSISAIRYQQIFNFFHRFFKE